MAGGRGAAGALAEPRRLMRCGLGLIVLGHGSLVLGAIVHGSVLRHVAGARRAVTPEYAVANVVSVGSGLLVSAGVGPRESGRGAPAAGGSGPAGPAEPRAERGLSPQSIAVGIVAILVSHNLSRAALVSAGPRGGSRAGRGPRQGPVPRQPLPWTLSPAAPSASRFAAFRCRPLRRRGPGGSTGTGERQRGHRAPTRSRNASAGAGHPAAGAHGLREAGLLGVPAPGGAEAVPALPGTGARGKGASGGSGRTGG